MIRSYPNACTGCGFCELICSLTKEGVVNPKKARIKVLRKNLETDIPIVCNQCGECIDACPEEAIYQAEKIVLIEEDKCTGCGACADVCPQGAIKIINELAIKCDECNGAPVCVDYCTQGGIKYE